MLRHIVLLKFKPDHTPEQVQAIMDGMDALPGQIPGILAYTHGTDAGVSAGGYDYGIVADFASDEDYQAYLTHPAHQAVGAHVVAIMADAAQVQIRV